MPRALVLLSGGIDSAVALWWALDAGHEVVPLSFVYPGRPRGEADAARALAACARVPAPLEAPLPFLREASEVPGWEAAPRGYVPARNALFYAAAAFHAELLGCNLVVGGHNGGDGDRFPDASPGFFRDLERLLGRGLWRPPGGERPGPRLTMPLLRLSKREVVELGRALGVPLDLAWSCYEDGDVACGECPSCLENVGLAIAGSA